VVAGIAAANGALIRVNDSYDPEDANTPYKYAGTVAAVVRKPEDFGRLAEVKEWELKEPDRKQWVWTDDYSNIIGALIRNWNR
jgi:hypothetical protein